MDIAEAARRSGLPAAGEPSPGPAATGAATRRERGRMAARVRLV